MVVLLVAAGAVWFTLEYNQRREEAALRALDEAKISLQSGNLPLAASDLTRVISTYQGTAAGDEAVVLLGRVRLSQGEPQTAAEELRAAIGRGLNPQFRAPAHGLLGKALEEAGQPAAAGAAYLQASETSWYTHLRARYLNEAGRALALAGDTVRAAEAYEQLIRDHPDVPAAIEARLRLAELRAAS